MLRLRESQMAQLDALEKIQYVREVQKNIVEEFPEYGSEQSLTLRLEQAYQHAVTIGLVDGPAITQFLYFEAFAPGFYRHPPIQAWLSKPGRSVEQRFCDLNAYLKSKLKEL